jgi:hypothetical protein
MRRASASASATTVTINIASLLALTACAHAGAWSHGDGIALPRMPTTGEHVLLEVELGVIGSGQEIVLRAPDGRLIGTVSPHGIRPGNAAGTYIVPVPGDAVASSLERGRLHLRFVIERAGAAARPATAEEVRNVRAVVIGNDPPR